MKELLPILVAVFGSLAYLPTLYDVFKGAKQNFATWALWALLDGIVTITVIVQHGNIVLPIVYALGSLSVTILLVFKKSMSWGKFETVIACMVCICLCLWATCGPMIATIASTTAAAIAGLPQLIATWKDPKSTSSLTYGLFSLANICSFIGAKAWTIEERFFPLVAGLLCILFFLFSLRKPVKN